MVYQALTADFASEVWVYHSLSGFRWIPSPRTLMYASPLFSASCHLYLFFVFRVGQVSTFNFAIPHTVLVLDRDVCLLAVFVLG